MEPVIKPKVGHASDGSGNKPPMVLKAESAVQCGCGGNCLCGDSMDKA